MITKSLILLFIFLLFAFLRFYNLTNRVPFAWDQEQFSTQIREIVKNHHFTLLGPRVNNDLGFFLAPYFTYLLVPFYLLTNLDPQALLYFLIIFNIVFFFISFLLIKNIFSFSHAIWFLFSWAINPLMQYYDVVPWWPVFIPLGSLTVLFLLTKTHQKSDGIKIPILLGLALGFFTNMHFQFVFIVFFTFIFYLLQFKKKSLLIKNIIFCGLAFLLTFLPLLIFDLRHDFLNSRLFLNFFILGADNQSKDLLAWLPVFTNFLKPYIYFRSIHLMFVLYVLLIFAIISLCKKGGFYAKFYQSVMILLFVFPFVFAFYGKRPSEYYFLFLSPIILIVIIDIFLKIRKEKLLILLSLILIILNFNWLKRNLYDDLLSLPYKKEVVRKIKSKYGKQSINIVFYGRSIDVGFKYLFDLYGLYSSGYYYDPLIQIGSPPAKESYKIGMYGIIIPKQLEPLN